ncbi:MAG: esterase family protein [Acidobacteria bacterium]|nr:esterase family protein [Acidobacteriota bacterium]
MKLRRPPWFAAVMLGWSIACAGQTAKNEVKTFRLRSTLMAREMPYQVILPADYENHNETARYPVIYLLHGLDNHYNDWTRSTKVAEYAAQHNFLIVTPEGGNGWYTDSVTVEKDQYESYIIKELIPEVDRNFRTIADRDHRVMAGFSMGGYGAVKFGLKYPAMFTLIGSFSGALGATSFNEKNAGEVIGTALTAIFGPEGSASRNGNDIFALLKAVTPGEIKKEPFIFQSCGTEDFLFLNNRDFQTLLLQKKIPHEYRERPGTHDWAFWDDQIREFLFVADRRVQKAKN